MKLSLGLLSVLFGFLFASVGCLTAATGKVEFDPSVPAGDEYVIEQKLPDGTWKEVAKGPASPVVFALPSSRPNTYTYRVRARWLATPTEPAVVSDPSNETSAQLTAEGPKNAKATTSRN